MSKQSDTAQAAHELARAVLEVYLPAPSGIAKPAFFQKLRRERISRTFNQAWQEVYGTRMLRPGLADEQKSEAAQLVISEQEQLMAVMIDRAPEDAEVWDALVMSVEWISSANMPLPKCLVGFLMRAINGEVRKPKKRGALPKNDRDKAIRMALDHVFHFFPELPMIYEGKKMGQLSAAQIVSETLIEFGLSVSEDSIKKIGACMRNSGKE